MKEQESEIERERGRERRRLMLARGARERVCEPRGAVTEHELQTCQVREGTSFLLVFRQTDTTHKEAIDRKLTSTSELEELAAETNRVSQLKLN